MSAMSGSRGRATRRPRWASFLLARLPILALSSFLLLAHTRNNSYSARAQELDQDPHYDQDEEDISLSISSCADLPQKRTEVHGIVAVQGDIVCQDKRIIRVSETIGCDVAIVAERVFHMKGIHFQVPSGTRMLFGMPAASFEKDKDSTEEIFTVDGILSFFPDQLLPFPEESTKEDKHSMIRLNAGGLMDTCSVIRYTDSGLTVAMDIADPNPTNSIKQDSRWAQRPRNENHLYNAPPLVSMFSPPLTTRETFGERLSKSPLYLNAGEELHWPSSMSSEEGTVLTIGADGSLLLNKHPAAAATAAVGAEDDPVHVPPVTLIAANARKARGALEKRQRVAGKAVEGEVSDRKDGFKVPGGAGGYAGGRTILKVTDVGDVEVTIDGKRVLHKAAPNNDRTWRRRIWDRVIRHKRPKGDYSMHLVSNGFEVRLDGATVWGVHAADIPSAAY